MRAWWIKTDTPGPILLANRDNAVVLNSVESASQTNEATDHALNVTSHGGVKAASIAGAIFNHKDDKKGQQDTFGGGLSNLEFQSIFQTHLVIVMGQIVQQLQYLFSIMTNSTVLEFVHDRKDKHVFTNMEQNI